MIYTFSGKLKFERKDNPFEDRVHSSQAKATLTSDV